MQVPHIIEGSLNMNENKIQEDLRIIHDTKSLVSNSSWKISSLEDPSFLEDTEKIQIAMCNIEGNFISLIFDRNNLVELNEWLHELYLNNNEGIHKLKFQNELTFLRGCKILVLPPMFYIVIG